MRATKSVTVPILAAVALASCAGEGTEPSAAVSPTVTASPTAPPDDGTAVAHDQSIDGKVDVAFADIAVTATPTRCAFDADSEAPADGSPRTALDVLAAGSGSDGEVWEVQLSRVLAVGVIIDTVSVHLAAGVPVDRYEAQRVVDTDQQQVEDLWGDSTNPLLMPAVNGDELTVRPPDDVTFGAFPAEREEPAEIAGTGTFSVTCSPVVD